MKLLRKVNQHRKTWLRRTKIMKKDKDHAMAGILKSLEEKCHPEFYKADISPALFFDFRPLKGEKLYRGICSNQEFQPGEDILTLPEELLITLSKLPLKLQALECNVHNKLAIYLYMEARRKKRSPIYPYLATLPASSSDHPVNLPSELIAALPSHMREIMEMQQAQIQEGFKVLKFLTKRPNFADFVYYWLCVNTRSVYFEVEKGGGDDDDEDDRIQLALAPFLDLLNHNSMPNAKIAKHPLHNGPYVIRATKKIEKFEQIYISYGEHPDFMIWIEYGFTPWSTNPHNYIPIESLSDLVPQKDGSRLSQMVWSALQNDERKVKIAKTKELDTELNLTANFELSPNLNLLISLMIWNPDKEDFRFVVDYENVDFWRLAVFILGRQLELYRKTLEIFDIKGKVDGCTDNTMEFLTWAIGFIEEGLNTMAEELDFLLHTKYADADA